MRLVTLRSLGNHVRYEEALGLQKEAVEKLKEAARLKLTPPHTLFLLEHTPVYTTGLRGARQEDLKLEEDRLKHLGADFTVADRGGLITFHGPGQLVAYPVLDLAHFGPSAGPDAKIRKKSSLLLGMKWYLHQLEQTVIDLCSKSLGLTKVHRSPHTGVWVGDNKVCAMGVRNSGLVTTHGIAINCNVDLSWFSHIVPCGIPDKGVTSISKELGRDFTVEEAIPLLLERFQDNFQCKEVSLVRRAEYRAILQSLVDNPTEFRRLAQLLMGEGAIITKMSFADLSGPTHLLLLCCQQRNFSLLDLVTASHRALEAWDATHALLEALTRPHLPINILRDLPEEVVEVELGSTLRLDFQAEGIPRLWHIWYFLGLDATDWKVVLDSADNAFDLVDITLEDAGDYRCRVTHWPDLYSGGKKDPGLLSRTLRVRVKKGSLFLNPTKPEDVPEAAYGSPVEFSVEAQADVDCLTFQWFRQDCDGNKALTGENRSTLRLDFIRPTDSENCRFFCNVSNGKRTLKSRVARILGVAPVSEEVRRRGWIEVKSDKIEILEQPAVVLRPDRTRWDPGDSVTLRVLAASSKGELRFRWTRKGVTEDLASVTTAAISGPLEVVSYGATMKDVLPWKDSVSYFLYQCTVSCPSTNEELETKAVKFPVSTLLAGDLAKPSRKIALVICQDAYESKDTFGPLNAPRPDGIALAKKLQEELNFQVFSFVNLTLSETLSALGSFCSLIDDGAFALFYYNGHAVGVGQDAFLAATDSKLDEPSLLWHGEILSRMNTRRPLLGAAIFDSCREPTPDATSERLKSLKGQETKFDSNFYVCFGTRSDDRSYEYTSGHTSQGLYVKHLLRHIGDNDCFDSVLNKVGESFVKEEDHSIVKRMLPVFRGESRQRLSLSAPLRGDPPRLPWDSHEPEIRMLQLTSKNDSKKSVLLSITLKPTEFLNEAEVAMDTDTSDDAGWAVQVVGINVELVKKLVF